MNNRVDVHDGWLRVTFGDPGGGTADFHLRWLRHNCDVDRHPLTRERIACSSELPDQLGARSAAIEGDALVVTWAHDERTSRYALDWLREHAYARDRAIVPPPSADPSRLEIALPGATLGELAARALARTNERGAAIVRRGPSATRPEDETESILEAFAATGLEVIGTHFGRIEDLRTDNTTNDNTDQLGYTDAAVDLHTDQPFLDRPPRWQLLQSIRAADHGGENDVVDAQAAARHLRSVDAEAYAILTGTPVVFHRRQAAFERTVVSPVLEEAGDAVRVRFSYFTMAPHRVPFERMESFYRAYDRFSRLVRDPRHRTRFTLAPGDFLLYDNRRMLHGRTAFRGARWLRGVYFDRPATASAA